MESTTEEALKVKEQISDLVIQELIGKEARKKNLQARIENARDRMAETINLIDEIEGSLYEHFGNPPEPKEKVLTVLRERIQKDAHDLQGMKKRMGDLA